MDLIPVDAQGRLDGEGVAREDPHVAQEVVARGVEEALVGQPATAEAVRVAAERYLRKAPILEAPHHEYDAFAAKFRAKKQALKAAKKKE